MSRQSYGWINLKTLTEANRAPLRISHIGVYHSSDVILDDVQGREEVDGHWSWHHRVGRTHVEATAP